MLQCAGIADPPSEHPTMPFGWIGQTASVAASRGLCVEQTLLEAGIAAKQERIASGTRLSPAEWLLMCVLLINSVDDEMHGTTRNRMRRGTASLGVKLLGSGANLGAAIGNLFHFYELAGGFCRGELIRDDRAATIQIRADGERSSVTTVVEELMAAHLHMIFSYYLGFYLPLDRFVTPSSGHPDLAGRHPYLGAAVVSGEVTELVFPAAYLALGARTPLHDKGSVDAAVFWLSCFEPAGGHEPWLSDAEVLCGRVYRALLADDLSFDDCCDLLKIDARSLRAELFAEGATYRGLRKAALIERVRPYLEQRVNADDIAYGLGYSDARSLRRALKSATGLNLSDMRQPGVRSGRIGADILVQNLRREMAKMG